MCKDSLFTAAVPDSAVADQVRSYFILLMAEACFSWLVWAVSDGRLLSADSK